MHRSAVLSALISLAALPAYAGELEDLKRKNEELERRIERLEKGQGGGHKEEEDAHKEEEPHPEEDHGRDLFHHDFGEMDARVNLHLVGMFAAGYSSVKDRFTERLQAGGHDPRRRGFNLQQIEIGFSGALEPYVSLDAFVVFTLEGVELEEASFKTLSLPAGLQIEGGYMYSEFGIINTQHPHEWDFLDHPVVNARLLGGDNNRGLGLRLGWLMPLPWFSEVHVGMQMANDESMVSFLGEGHAHGGEATEESPGGFARVERDTESFYEFLYLLRWHNRVACGEFRFDVGASGLFGPNATGDTGKTWLAGGDIALRWRPIRGEEHAFLLVQGEVLYRYFQANEGLLEGDPADPLDVVRLEPTVLGDWGGYVYALVTPLTKWSFGLRFEFADAFREGEEPRVSDSARDRRVRLSPIIEWRPCKFARLRLQYNFDHVQHLRESTAHGVWLGVEIALGTHRH